MLVIGSGFCTGQKDFRTGYVITNSSDTVYGLINLKSNYQNSRSCEFVSENNSMPEVYSPRDIVGYRIENSKYYLSRVINKDNELQIVFLEYLVDGIVDLFYLKDFEGDYFFIEKEGVLYQLSNEDKKVIANDDVYEVKSNQYKGVLSSLFKESPSALRKINTTPFSYKPLIDLTKDYHNEICTHQECIDYTKSSKTKIWIEPFAGISYTMMGLNLSEKHTNDLGICYGMNIRFIPFRSHYRWNLLAGVSVLSNNLRGTFNDDLDSLVYISTEFNTVRIPITVEYNFPGKNIQPFLSLSYCTNLVHIKDYHTRYEDYPIQSYLLRKVHFEPGISFAAGFRHNLTESAYLMLKNEIEIKHLNSYIYSSEYTNETPKLFSDMLSIGFGFNIN